MTYLSGSQLLHFAHACSQFESTSTANHATSRPTSSLTSSFVPSPGATGLDVAPKPWRSPTSAGALQVLADRIVKECRLILIVGHQSSLRCYVSSIQYDLSNVHSHALFHCLSSALMISSSMSSSSVIITGRASLMMMLIIIIIIIITASIVSRGADGEPDY